MMTESNEIKMDQSKTESTKPKRSQLVILVLFGVGLALIAGKVMARIAVRWRWTPEKIRAMTIHTIERQIIALPQRIIYIRRFSIFRIFL